MAGHKNLDLSYKTDLDLWDFLGKVKLLLIIAKYHKTDLDTCSHSREGKTLSYGQTKHDEQMKLICIFNLHIYYSKY